MGTYVIPHPPAASRCPVREAGSTPGSAVQGLTEIDDLPGSEKPLSKRGDQHDPNGGSRGLIEREDLDKAALLPEAFRLRHEAETFPESLASLDSEKKVRSVLEDFNQRVRRERLHAVTETEHRLLAATVDVEEMMDGWRLLRGIDGGAMGERLNHAGVS